MVPVPVCEIPPGAEVNVQVPVAGKPLTSTLPVGERHVGCVTVPAIGAEGVAGCAFIVAEVLETVEVQPSLFVTVKVYVLALNPVKVPVVPVPVCVNPPGVAVIVHVPVEGKPLIETSPVATVHVGWVIDPTIGAIGVIG